jgi:hypothetical protein
MKAPGRTYSYRRRPGYRPSGRPPTRGGPWIPAPVIVALIEPLIEAGSAEGVARRLRVDQRRLSHWRTGYAHWVSFELAERVIVELLDDPSLWYTVPELAAVYQQLA